MSEPQITAPTDEEMLDAARRAELTWRTFRYAAETIAAAVQARADIESLKASLTTATAKKDEIEKAVADEIATLNRDLAERRVSQRQQIAALTKAHEKASQELAEINTELESRRSDRKQVVATIESDFQSKLAEIETDYRAKREAMETEIAALQKKLDDLNAIVAQKREAVLALG